MKDVIKLDEFISENMDMGDGRFYEDDTSDVNLEKNNRILSWTPPAVGDPSGLDNYKNKYYLIKTYGYNGKEFLSPEEIKNLIKLPLAIYNGTIVIDRSATHRNVFADNRSMFGLREQMGSGDMPACSCKSKKPKKQKKMKWNKSIMAEKVKTPKVYEKCTVCGGIKKKKRKAIKLSDYEKY